jgi:hypothetical protein
VLGREAPAERVAEQRVGEDRDQRHQDQPATDARFADGDQAAGKTESDVPSVSQSPVRPIPERLDRGGPATRLKLVAQPVGRATFRVRARGAAFELRESPDGLEPGHRIGDHRKARRRAASLTFS